ncbi:MAG: hypothetical protein N3A69_16430, partial [Leptospiraceae bacterium]|nr:hypothetical protein [Leptospiraceae bacterium]
MIHLQPLGETNFDLQWLAKELEKKFEKATIVNPKIEIPISCFNRRRGQFNSTCIITFFKTEVVTLFITEKDIYADDMNFVFGEAEIGGKRAIISINRLKSQDENLFRQRVLKEAIHA